MDLATDMDDADTTAPDDRSVDRESETQVSEADRNLHKRIAETIRADKKHHAKAFKRMRMSMRVALRGRTDDWNESNYVANIIGRHIKAKTAALYAKNPKAVARRRETLDFTIWDEDEKALMLAFDTIQNATMMLAQTPNVIGMDGQPVGGPTELPPGFEQAQALIADFQQGMQRRQQSKKIGKTLEILFAQSLREQKPIDFKAAMKQLVRRACTTSVGYVEVGFQREKGPRPGMTEKLADARTRLDHLRKLSEDAAAGEIDNEDAEMAELERSIAELQSEPEIVLQEGLIFDFPQSTRVVPDRLCKSLMGFIGARHLTIEYLFTKDEVREMFDVNLTRQKYTPYNADGRSTMDDDEGSTQRDLWEDGDENGGTAARGDLCCVWKYYDKPSGMVYYLLDGYDGFIREPAAPDVFVEDFWPVYALTFNAVESEDELFPPSDVELLISMQQEYNRARQGQRQHRDAAKPRYVAPIGVLSEDDKAQIESAAPFTVSELNIEPGTDIKSILQVVPMAGVDPNLYETNQLFTDMQLVVGTQEAQLGGTSKSTATEAAIAQGASSSSDGSSIDDLDTFLTAIARAAGQILLKEMSPEKVMEIAGPGALWPQMTLAQIAGELFLEVEAGSTGKPNQAAEIQNWERLLPSLIQMPTINPTWLARETLRRLDDRLDLTEALVGGMASIVAQNRAATATPGGAPEDQGAAGADNGPQPPGGPSGTGAAFGSNQV